VIKSKITFIFIFVLFLFFIPTTYAITYSEQTEQIFTINESDIIHVKFIDTINVSEYYITSHSFRLPVTWNISGFAAYDFSNTSHHLNFTIEKTNFTFNTIFFHFPENRNNSYTLVFEFDYRNPYDRINNFRYFYWAWGGADYLINLKYVVNLPAFYDVEFSNETYEKITERNFTILTTNGVAMPNEFFTFWFYVKKVNPPQLKITKLINLTQVKENEPFYVIVDVTNLGGSLAKNISIADKVPGVFKLESGQLNWFGDIESGKTETIKYVLRGTAPSANEPLGVVEASYTDIWGSKFYSSVSNQPSITIEKTTEILDIYGIKVPIPFGDPLLIIYNFFIGYLVMFSIFVIKRKDYNAWSSMPSIDKVIYSIFSSIINFVTAIILGGIMILLLIPFVLLLEIHPLTIPNWPMYLLLIIAIPFTSYKLDEWIENVKRSESNAINWIVNLFSKNKKKLILLYTSILIFFIILKLYFK